MNKEGLNIEYKREYVDDINKTVVAFANTNGGKIYVGIDDNGSIVGVSNTDETILRITNTIRDSIKPDVTLFSTCNVEIIKDKAVVVITVQKGSACPYYIAIKGIRPEGVYVRQGASSVPATETAILKMIKDTSRDSYEEIRSLNQELSFKYLIKEFKEAHIDIDNIKKRSLGLIGSEGLYNNLGLLLSDQCTHTIKVAVFEGTTKEIFKDRYEFEGSLLRQLREAYSFIDRYNRTRSEFEELKRIDIRDYPTTAIREALLNSIVHRDYSFSGSSLISIFDNRIEFVTIGGLVRGISKDDMLLGVSMLRNKNLANVFYRLKLIEAFGTGIPKIMESYENNLLLPKIEVTDNAFKITLFSKSHENINGKMSNNVEQIYTESEKKILDLFNSKANIKRIDVEKALNISQSMAIKHIKSLIDKKAIISIGKGKNVTYKLK